MKVSNAPLAKWEEQLFTFLVKTITFFVVSSLCIAIWIKVSDNSEVPSQITIEEETYLRSLNPGGTVIDRKTKYRVCINQKPVYYHSDGRITHDTNVVCWK